MEPPETASDFAQRFEDVYKAYRHRIFNLCRYLLGSSDTAEDATHEVFLRAQAKFSTYDASKPLSSWLAGIAGHFCVDQLRRRALEKRLFEGTPSEDHPSPCPGLDPLGQLLNAEQGAEVRAALALLPERYRVALVLAYYSELGYSEIADVMGVGRNTVSTFIFRGKRELREHLARSERSGLSK